MTDALAAAPPASPDRRALGIALVATSALFWSSAGLFIRLVDLDVWTVSAWRAVFASLAMVVLMLVLPRRGGTFGGAGMLAMLLTAVSALCFIAALKATTVANVYAIYATLPLAAGAIGWIVLRERVERRLIVASLAALAGVVLVAGGSPRFEDMGGNALALFMTGTFAALVVMSRRTPSLDLLKINALGCLLLTLAMLPLMQHTIPSARELAILAAFGISTTGGAYVLFLIGSRFIRSAEAGLVGLLDVPLAPLWVWLAFGEQPPVTVLAGGAVILAATVWTLWPRRPTPPAPPTRTARAGTPPR